MRVELPSAARPHPLCDQVLLDTTASNKRNEAEIPCGLPRLLNGSEVGVVKEITEMKAAKCIDYSCQDTMFFGGQSLIVIK